MILPWTSLRSAERESVTTEPFLLQADVNEESYN